MQSQPKSKLLTIVRMALQSAVALFNSKPNRACVDITEANDNDTRSASQQSASKRNTLRITDIPHAPRPPEFHGSPRSRSQVRRWMDRRRSWWFEHPEYPGNPYFG